MNYLRSWFLLDVIAAFPIGYILLFAVNICLSVFIRHFIRLHEIVWDKGLTGVVCSQDLQYHSQDNPSKTNKMMRILMFLRILSLIRLVRVSRLVRFFNEVEKVSGEEPHSALETLSSSSGLSGCRYPEQLPGSGDAVPRALRHTATYRQGQVWT